MQIVIVKWCVDLGMGITFLVSFVTGLFKFSLFQRMLGLYELPLPMAFISDIHDWSGLALGVFVAVHLFLNRQWIMTMTKKILSGKKDTT
ncbi:MAG: DUF4405 domain-containing protein [Methanoregulaceae archaeon]